MRIEYKYLKVSPCYDLLLLDMAYARFTKYKVTGVMYTGQISQSIVKQENFVFRPLNKI